MEAEAAASEEAYEGELRRRRRKIEIGDGDDDDGFCCCCCGNGRLVSEVGTKVFHLRGREGRIEQMQM